MFQNKAQIITQYIESIDFNGDWNYRDIENELGKILGEKPAINITYKKDVILNEFNSESKEITKIDKFEIVFSPNLDVEFQTLSFTIN